MIPRSIRSVTGQEKDGTLQVVTRRDRTEVRTRGEDASSRRPARVLIGARQGFDLTGGVLTI